jgi:hypothetical protein
MLHVESLSPSMVHQYLSLRHEVPFLACLHLDLFYSAILDDRKFNDEKDGLKIKHEGPGFISMANRSVFFFFA